MKKRILVVSQYFYPEQFRINDICHEWVKRGHEVTVLTGIPNYPIGSFYKGYGFGKKRQDEYNGIKIIRLPIFPRKKNSIMLALNYISFVLSGYIWARFHKEDYDVVYIYEVSPMTQALPAVSFSKKKKIPCYIYVMDLWPENFQIITGINNTFLIKYLNKMVDYIYENCSIIFTASESFKKNIEDRGVPADKIKFWPQYAEEFYKPNQPNTDLTEKISDFLTITFAGNVGEAQGLHILPAAAELLKKKKIFCRFLIVGDGRYKEQLKQKISSIKVEEYFEFIDPVPAKEIPKILSISDFSLVSLKENEIFSMTIPAKLQSSMACGVPILVSASGEVQEVVKKAKCGFVSNSGDVESFVNNIIEATELSEENLKKMGNNSREYYLNNYDKDYLMETIEVYL